ncbi:hypothetical protein [Brevibacillus porteri]|uniref:hypothetical protein n=1 Tax=Brevibacillus porteri TaxID=2126350 RepID=UPI003D1BB0D0
MNIANLLAAHGIGSGGVQKNSFVPFESFGVSTDLQTSFTAGDVSIGGGVAIDNAGSVYAIDNNKVLRKYNKTGGGPLLSITLPSTDLISNIFMEYCAAVDRIVCLDKYRLFVLDTSLNLLYNQPFPDQPSKAGILNFLVRSKYLYHVMNTNNTLGYRLQKFDLSTLSYVFDNAYTGSYSSDVRYSSTIEVDDQDNFYVVGANNLYKFDKTGVPKWIKATSSEVVSYLYYDKIDQKLYTATHRGKSGYFNVTTGDMIFTTGSQDSAVGSLDPIRGRTNAYDSGVALLKLVTTNLGYSHALVTTYKQSGMRTNTNVAHLVFGSNSYNIHSVASRKGYTVVSFSNDYRVYIFRTGVKML